jgi:hypothetical protein
MELKLILKKQRQSLEGPIMSCISEAMGKPMAESNFVAKDVR